MALAAVAFHLILSFAHVHPWSVSAQASSSIEAPDTASPDSPLEPAAYGNCAICANIAAFASLDMPRAMAARFPAFRAIARLFPPLPLRPEGPRGYRLFQTRAPPSTASRRPF